MKVQDLIDFTIFILRVCYIVWLGMELYLVVGEMKPVSPNFNPSTILLYKQYMLNPYSANIKSPIFAYSILSPNIIPANISGHMVQYIGGSRTP